MYSEDISLIEIRNGYMNLNRKSMGYSNNFVGKTCHRFSHFGWRAGTPKTQRNRNGWWKRLPHKELGGGNSNIVVFTPIPIWGRWTHFDDHIFKIGLVQPPTCLLTKKTHHFRGVLLLLMFFWVAKMFFWQPIQRKPPHSQHLKPGNPPGKSPTHPPLGGTHRSLLRRWSLVLARDTWDFCWRIYGQTFPWSSWRWRSEDFHKNAGIEKRVGLVGVLKTLSRTPSDRRDW